MAIEVGQQAPDAVLVNGDRKAVKVSELRGKTSVLAFNGRADRIETVLEALLVQEGERGGFEPFDSACSPMDSTR